MLDNTIEILGNAVSKGKGIQLNLDIATLHTRTKIEVPVIIERAKKDGPCMLITGGIHGDEFNGIEIVRQIISKGYNKPTCGTIICIPVVNIFGFLNQSREFPDGRDLNRVFPGNERGSLASRFAYHLMTEIVPHIDYCIDFHTGGRERFNAPQIRISEDAETSKLAEIFEAPFILKSKNREKSFRDSCVKQGKKVLLFEGGKSLSLNNEVTDIGVSGALKVMQHLGIRNFTKELKNYKNKTKMQPTVVEKSSWVRARYSGMYHPIAQTGAYVEKGAIIGSISGPYGDFEKQIKAPNAGYIICTNQAPIVNQGDALIHLTK
ncbi:N-alpha-acetyl-L-2,4-diaminobutyric acid deacetylase [Kordia antarctica]|uniref:N-alpha-acetyl-L-2,4-diaminobutyric acid deacetylase n=1 Tax=Kordia antarctica TaxID=1218801 RepID=A0A7L4ZR80_9FLAO|nr:succinylglutamate desuccinylase/aspartoacylase family protein [Kordia antarctica]QHI39122.1 N-alpha-acetyl-L-2,4-diaminobutyric acid deacetylase [Kordia antarctica]